MIPDTLTPIPASTDQILAELTDAGWSIGMEAPHRTALVERFTLYAAPQGAVICGEGHAGDFIGLVVSGRLRVSKSADFGSDRSLVNLGPGMSFGEMAFVDGQDRSASVSAAEDSTVLLLSRGDFDDLAAKRPDLAVGLLLQLLRHLSQRLRQTTERSVQRGF